MVEENEESQEETSVETEEEAEKKPRFKIGKPNPLIFVFLVPAIVVFGVYILLTKFFISSDLMHEEKLEMVLEEQQPELIDGEGAKISETSEVMLDPDGNPIDEAGMLDTHTYYNFEVSFAVNVMNSKKLLTFDLAVSTFQPGVLGRFFFEGFGAFIPALRSDILYYMGRIPLEKLQDKEFQKEAEADLKDIINIKLESLGSKPAIYQVFLQRLLIV